MHAWRTSHTTSSGRRVPAPLSKHPTMACMMRARTASPSPWWVASNWHPMRVSSISPVASGAWAEPSSAPRGGVEFNGRERGGGGLRCCSSLWVDKLSPFRERAMQSSFGTVVPSREDVTFVHSRIVQTCSLRRLFFTVVHRGDKGKIF